MISLLTTLSLAALIQDPQPRPPAWAHANPLRYHAEQCGDHARPADETPAACASRVAALLRGTSAPLQRDAQPNSQSETTRNCSREARRDPDSGDSSSSASCSWSFRRETRR